MIDHAFNRDRLFDLLGAVCNDIASPDELTELDSVVQNNADARDWYRSYCRLHGTLRLELRANRATHAVYQQIGIDTASEGSCEVDTTVAGRLPNLPPPTFLSTSFQGAVGHFSSGWPVAYLVATVIFGIGLVVGAFTYVSQPVHVATQPPSVTRDTMAPEQQTESVGRITGMVDCKWNAPSKEAFEGTRVPLGRKYALSSGLMEITYDTGAKVFLQGPVTYKVESRNGGVLQVGKLTAKVEAEKAKGFCVRTANATVTDLGTEFGVEVDKQGCTTSRVFRGSVRVQVVTSDGRKEGVAHVLHQNESVQVVSGRDKSGTESRTIVIPSVKLVEFVRTIPQRTVKVLDLVDALAGGDGFSGQRGRGIDPTAGQISDNHPSTFFPTFAGDYQYHRADRLAFVDGVFIPNGGKGPVQVDSAGHFYDGFDKTDNLTHGHIWAGGMIAPADVPQAMRTDLCGADDYASHGHGLILLRANSGITFDLDAIRRTMPGGKILRFRANGGNTATFADARAVNFDLFVLVDGQERFVRRKVAGWGGSRWIMVPLADKDRFLTLAFTDGGDGCGWDWTILGDPRLEMAVTESSGDSGANAKVGEHGS